jgi:tetratricopeptide (TPR) repeat protein
MKSKYVILASALLVSIGSFAQKDQIKAAEKALKGGNAAEAITILNQAASASATAPDAEKAQYFFVKGNAYLDLANKKVDLAKNLTAAGKAYTDLIAVEKVSGKAKYTADAQASIVDVKNQLINGAIEQGTKKNYKPASEMLHAAYELDKTDVEKLYYAASYAINGQDYDTALNYYQELKKLNYTGAGTGYYAKNVLNDQEEYFGTTAATKTDRDNKVKLKLYTNPRDEKVESKRSEILEKIALILVQQGKDADAKSALAEARNENPSDVTLMLAEANLYLKLSDFAMYKKVMADVLATNPTDPDLFYNMGVVAGKTDAAAAEGYYKKAIELKPDYVNAYLNLAILKLAGDKAIVDEMNKLGTSDKDTKRYDVLKKQRDAVFNGALPYLEKANQLAPKNEDVANTLLNVYSALEMTDKKKALKASMAK